MAVSNVELRVDSRQAVNALRDVNRASAQTDSAINKLQGTIGRLAGAFAAIQAAKFVFVQAAEIESQTRSLQVLTGSAKQAKQIVEELQQLGAVTPFTSTELIDAAKRLQAFGVAASDVVETTRRLADASGATGAELQGLVTAYGQVQAKGRLQGEELLQFQERGIAMQQELRKMYGMTGDEFQKALSKGQISAKAVEVALQRLTSAGGKYANGAIAQSDTLNGKLSTLQDSFQRLAQNIGKFFEPVFKFLLDGINAFLERVNSAAALQAQTRAYQQASERTRTRFGARVMNPFDTEVQQYRQRLEKSLVRAEMGTVAPAFKAGGPVGGAPALLTPTSGAGGKGAANKAAREAERAAEAAAKEQERVAQVIRERLAEGQILQLRSTIQDKIAAAEAAGDKQLAVRLKGQEKELDIQYRYAQELAKEKDIRAQEAIIYEGNTALVANQREIQRELNELQQESAVNQIAALERQVNLQAELTDGQRLQQELGNGIANTIGQGMTSAFDALIQGSESFSASLRRIASGVLVDIARQLIQIYIINKAISAIGNLFGPKAGGLSYSGVSGSALSTSMLSGNFTATPFSTAGMGLSFRANGGSVRAGQPYVVGERGPELFMPGRSGGIAPTGSFGGGVNVVVNVDATGSKVQGDQGQGAQLGRVVANAVQAELIKQKRPGGLLA
jgi:tape measure domain-containing protein